MVKDIFRLDQRTVVLTGGLGGLGTSLTHALLYQGADIISLDVREVPEGEQWQKLQNLASQLDRRLSYKQCDATDPESVKDVFEWSANISRYPVRGLVALAGISDHADALTYDVATFRRVIDVNVTGTFLSAQAAARLMRRHNEGGSIVLIASISGTVVNKGVNTVAYNTSKSAVLQMGRSLAAEWGGNKDKSGIKTLPIRVNTISPGYIVTPMTMPTANGGLQQMWEEGNMLGRLSTVDEHHASVIYLLSDGSSYVTASDLRADGGHCAW